MKRLLMVLELLGGLFGVLETPTTFLERKVSWRSFQRSWLREVDYSCSKKKIMNIYYKKERLELCILLL